MRAGFSYRSYGWFADQGKPNIKTLKSKYCPTFKGYDMGYKDIDRFTVGLMFQLTFGHE